MAIDSYLKESISGFTEKGKWELQSSYAIGFYSIVDVEDRRRQNVISLVGCETRWSRRIYTFIEDNLVLELGDKA